MFIKQIISKLVLLIFGCEVLLIIYLCWNAYFIRSTNQDTGVVTDGFGRVLEPAPIIVRNFITDDPYWQGWIASGGDIFIAIFLIAIGAGLWKLFMILENNK